MRRCSSTSTRWRSMRPMAPATNTPSCSEEVRASRDELLEATGIDEAALLDDYP